MVHRGPTALREATRFLRDQTGLQPISNEFGQRSNDPTVTRKLLSTISDLGLPFVVWFSSDTAARSLVNPDGTLRPTGAAFRGFIQQRYGLDHPSSRAA